MNAELRRACIAGVERVIAWSTLLDEINVFPVADGDTGRNLVISMAPLLREGLNMRDLPGELLLSARGNSGNIASRFFSVFLTASTTADLPEVIRKGRDAAWKSVPDPKPGTMLSVFDALLDASRKPEEWDPLNDSGALNDILENVVKSSMDHIPRLKEAGVVDSGALGMYIFFHGFFSCLAGRNGKGKPITEKFGPCLKVAPGFNQTGEKGFCVDSVVRIEDEASVRQSESFVGSSIVSFREGDFVKLHIHTDDPSTTREKLESMGSVVEWSQDDIRRQSLIWKDAGKSSVIHIITDGAGSVTTDDAKEFGFTLLNSYIHLGNRSYPETFLFPEKLYDSMRKKVPVSTSQASNHERMETFTCLSSLYSALLYLCVGSVYTGNFEVANQWKREMDPEGSMRIIDTGSASGRLGIAVLATARFAQNARKPGEVVRFAQKAVQTAQEYVFLDRLEYLAAGGRLSKTSAFFGDMLHMKPVITPAPEGAKKIGMTRSEKHQIEFALEKLKTLGKDQSAFVMIQYSDNRGWVETVALPEIERTLPKAEIITRPLSLTSGAHMGPGTWAVAFLPERLSGRRNTR